MQPRGERRALPPRDRRLRTLRRDRDRHACASRRAARSSGSSRCVDVDGADGRLRRSGSPRAISTATSSSRSTRTATTSCARASSPATARSTRRDADPAGAAGALRGGLADDSSSSPTPTSGAPSTPTPPTTWRRRAALLVGHAPDGRLHSTTTTRCSTDGWACTVRRHRDDHRDLRAARRPAALHGRRPARTSARNDVDLIYGTIRLIERDDESFLAWATRAVGLHHLQPPRRHTPEAASRAPPPPSAA